MAFKVLLALYMCPSSSPERTMIRRFVVLAILTWKQPCLSRLTSPSGTCTKESDPLFKPMPSRYIDPWSGAPHETAVIVAMDSGKIVRDSFATAFHWEHLSLVGFLVGVTFVFTVATSGAQVVVKASFGARPGIAGMR